MEIQAKFSLSVSKSLQSIKRVTSPKVGGQLELMNGERLRKGLIIQLHILLLLKLMGPLSKEGASSELNLEELPRTLSLIQTSFATLGLQAL